MLVIHSDAIKNVACVEVVLEGMQEKVNFIVMLETARAMSPNEAVINMVTDILQSLEKENTGK